MLLQQGNENCRKRLILRAMRGSAFSAVVIRKVAFDILMIT